MHRFRVLIFGVIIYIDVFEPHTQAITKSIWDEKHQVLYTASKDKSIKVWRVPEEWHVYFLKQEIKKKEPEVVVAPAKMEKKEKGSDDGSDDDDDLKGWNK